MRILVFYKSMKINVHTELPDEAMSVRISVFTHEQGLVDKPDETDRISYHLLLSDDDGKAIGTCRIFPSDDDKTYILGRLAIIKEYREKGYGSMLVRFAEGYVKNLGAAGIILHSQYSSKDFYSKLGYIQSSEKDTVQGVEHIWMSHTF